jgi:hypothetical protein
MTLQKVLFLIVLPPKHIYRSALMTKSGNKRVGRSIRVVNYNLDGNLESEYSSITVAARALGIPQPTICRAMKTTAYTAGGFYWRAIDGNASLPSIKVASRSIYQYDVKGNFIQEFTDINHASEILNMRRQDISVSAKADLDKLKKRCGFYFRGEKFKKLVIGKKPSKYRTKETISGTENNFSTLNEVGVFFGVKGQAIQNKLSHSKNRIEYHGYIITKIKKKTAIPVALA